MENKDHENPRACVHIHAYAHAFSSSTYTCFMHAYAYTGMHTHAKVPKTIKNKFFALKFVFGTNPISSGSHSKNPFFYYKKLYIVHIQNKQKILRENTRFTKNSELKKEFFTKHP